MPRNSEFHTGRTYQSDLEPVTAQVASAYHNEHGGSSFNVLTGTPARSGYAIGGMSKVGESSIPSRSITAAEFQGHRDAVRAAYPGNSKAHAGTWLDEGSGKTVLDASQVETSRSKAAKLQTSRNEDAVFNINEGKEEDLRPKTSAGSKRSR